ncbi:uncharacterized protein LOC142178272 [Nicotiana tabacum]|uniref:Uncharacterized protein LOC142178272 n=1 Tax=Nicotiana tabacum TaxID=4097 RepID=A0AC58U2K1_TOBAC
MKRENLAIQFAKFLEILKQIHINVPFTNALLQMPSYAKLLKEILSSKRKLEEVFVVMLTEICSAILQNRLPPKLGDPGSFTIPCTLGGVYFEKTLYDSRASINLMSFSIFRKLNLGEMKDICVSLQFAYQSTKKPKGIIENMLVKVDKFVFPIDFIVLEMKECPDELIILGGPFLATGKAIIDVHQGQLILRFDEERIIFDMQKILRFSGDKTPSSCFSIDMLNYLTDEFKDDQLILDSMERCLAKSGTTQNDDPIIRREAEILEKDFEDEVQPEQVQPKIELKVLPSYLKYVYLEKELFPVIISSSLTAGQEEKLIKVLKAHKGALGWTIEDIKGINPAVCMHIILMEDSYRQIVQPQRRLNPTMQEVVKKEIVKLLAAGIIYPISDSPWVSPVQVVPKKGGMAVIKNESNELIPTRTITRRRVCIDYRRLNNATRKDHFPLPFINQMLERIAGYDFYCFLDGYSGYNQMPIALEDQDKITFTCPQRTYAYRIMLFGLCNAPATFQRCMSAIFSDMTEKFLEIFMDDFTLFGKIFEDCLHHLTLVLKRCEKTNLIFNWEKSYFMVSEGIVLGHKITAKGIEVDKAKINLITRLPPPTTVKGIRSFLCHTGFYRRFIKDFSKISKPLTNLLVKDIKFDFSGDCLKAFETLKEKLSTAPIVVSPDWNQPFEVMCDASDIAVGVVLGQRKDKIFRSIYYASRTMNEAQLNYANKKKNNIIRRCVPEDEMSNILYHCHDGAIGGHYAANRITFKVLEAGFFWLTLFKDTRAYVAQCDKCQRTCNITKSDEMLLQSIQVNELEELRLIAYENARIFKDKTKIWHDNLIRQQSFQVGDQVLLYNSRLRLFPRKLKSRWTGPYNVTDVTPYGTIEIQQNNGGDKFKVNGHRLKMYFGGHFEQNSSVTLTD